MDMDHGSVASHLRGRRGERGFTLIELLVVITILGILAGVVIFAVQGIGDKGREKSVAADAATLRTAEEAHCAKFGRYATVGELIDRQLLGTASTYNNVSLDDQRHCGTSSKSSFEITEGGGTTEVVPGAETINVGLGGGDIAVNPETNRIYVANRGSDTISVINGKSDTVIDTINVGDFPQAIAVDADRNRIFVVNRDSSNVSVIRGTDNQVVDTEALPDSGAGSVAINPATGDAYVALDGSGTLTRIDTSNVGHPIDLAAVGNARVGGGLAVNGRTGIVYLLTATNQLAMIRGGTVLGSISHTMTSSNYIAVDETRNKVFVSGRLSSPARSRIVRFNGASADGSTLASVEGPPFYDESTTAPNWQQLVVDPFTHDAYIYESSTFRVGRFSPTQNRFTQFAGNKSAPTTPLGPAYHLLALNPNTSRVYLPQRMPGSGGATATLPGGIAVVDTRTMATETLLGGRYIGTVAVNPATNKVYALDQGSAVGGSTTQQASVAVIR